MKELENLKELYLEEIKAINKKGELTPADSEAAKKALEALEKIDELCEKEDMDEEYSERMYPRRYMRRSMNSSYNHPYDNGMMPEMRYDYSNRRGRSSVTGRYISRHGDSTVDRMLHKLDEMRVEAPNEETRMAIDKVIDTLEAY